MNPICATMNCTEPYKELLWELILMAAYLFEEIDIPPNGLPIGTDCATRSMNYAKNLDKGEKTCYA